MLSPPNVSSHTKSLYTSNCGSQVYEKFVTIFKETSCTSKFFPIGTESPFVIFVKNLDTNIEHQYTAGEPLGRERLVYLMPCVLTVNTGSVACESIQPLQSQRHELEF